MSHIGKKLIRLPESVNINIINNIIKVSGELGELEISIYKYLNLNITLKDKYLYLESQIKNNKY